MILWRISRHLDLSGIGGLKADGRWHNPGQPIVYLAESPSAALLEVCVHTSANDIPPDFTLLKIEGPTLEIIAIVESDLPVSWQNNLETTRNLGTQWLRSNAAVLLRVPSAIVPQTSNFLFNPLHAAAAHFRIVDTLTYPFDTRIKR
ncbi:RES family NAD+ phosphorylase [Granulicella sp. 5B5]|uniref:RES family NAD+ phosphorylase n=1 Tax=Granulicella sp. 5B5 TaxID=1617967 RepID=UPI001C716A71|nr:RES family NAD+ phosphorylase [Granulicella sp. 5B5]